MSIAKVNFNSKRVTLQAIPTNIITGFLGAGKTTTILHLLSGKPEGERWAVLVNEFGEIGVDGSLLRGHHQQEQDVFIREVPGGCMCCAAGLPMHIALNQLLSRAEPDRLLIEPTGLGHPLEVLQTLSSDYFREIISIQRVITVLDARKLKDTRYTDSPIFRQQIAIADLVLGNKLDLYQPTDKSNLKVWVQQLNTAGAEVIFSENGVLSATELQGTTAAKTDTGTETKLYDGQSDKTAEEYQPLSDGGYARTSNSGDGFSCVGWRFCCSKIFNRGRLFTFFTGLPVVRMKSVFITGEGLYGYNLADGTLTEYELDDCLESRIEIIATTSDDRWEEQLLVCLEEPI